MTTTMDGWMDGWMDFEWCTLVYTVQQFWALPKSWIKITKSLAKAFRIWLKKICKL